MPTLPQLKSALDALAFRLRSLSGKERARLGRREMDELDALIQLGRDDTQRFPEGPGRADELARLDRLVAQVSARFERLLSEPARAAPTLPPSAAAGQA
jgi:hypothetical protein